MKNFYVKRIKNNKSNDDDLSSKQTIIITLTIFIIIVRYQEYKNFSSSLVFWLPYFLIQPKNLRKHGQLWSKEYVRLTKSSLNCFTQNLRDSIFSEDQCHCPVWRFSEDFLQTFRLLSIMELARLDKSARHSRMKSTSCLVFKRNWASLIHRENHQHIIHSDLEFIHPKTVLLYCY